MLTSKPCRYGQAGMDQTDSTVSKGGIAITVDVNMPENSPLQELRSPSHPIAVVLGKTSTSESQPPHLSRASATLSLGTSTLDKDFILEIMYQVGYFRATFPIQLETSIWVFSYFTGMGEGFSPTYALDTGLAISLRVTRWALPPLSFLFSISVWVARHVLRARKGFLIQVCSRDCLTNLLRVIRRVSVPPPPAARLVSGVESVP